MAAGRARQKLFQSTLPVWGATDTGALLCCIKRHFNPRSPCGERLVYRFRSIVHNTYFNPRSPCGERRVLMARGSFLRHISIHAPRVGSDVFASFGAQTADISIHAPRVGSDYQSTKALACYINISIHAPRVGSDSKPPKFVACSYSFQSTLPVWGATSPLGASGGVPCKISIHAPRVGSDLVTLMGMALLLDFNPRSPCGERLYRAAAYTPCTHFNPRSPCGERLFRLTVGRPAGHFNPRSPCGERLRLFRRGIRCRGISIHAPRVGSDDVSCRTIPTRSIFQSTLPVWGATYIDIVYIF